MVAARSNHISLVDMIIKADRLRTWKKVLTPCTRSVRVAEGAALARGGASFEPQP